MRSDRAASALALIAVVPALASRQPAARALRRVPDVYQSATEPGLAFNGVPVSNVFPFDRSGKPLNDVLLYLPNGQPMNVAAQVVDYNRRYLVTRRGQRLYNSFPVRYFDPGTATVARPNAGPPVRIPNVLTPPLGSQAP